MPVDLSATIVPGLTAAGFEIGRRIQDYQADLAEAKPIRFYKGFDLVREISQNTGVLRIDRLVDDEGPCFYFGPDTVRLVFTRGTGLLACIYVFAGYAGTYGQAAVGSPLSSVSAVEPLEYDPGDDMYYRVNTDGEIVPGLAIVAIEVSSSVHATTAIDGFCVHDWSLFKFRNGA